MRLPRHSGITVLWTLQIIMLVTKVSCSGVFELQLTSFTNDNGLNADGNCCNGIRKTRTCTSSCRTFFRVCLTHYQATISNSPQCTYGSVTTPVLGDNTFEFSDMPSDVEFTNPIKLPFSFEWPGTFSLIIEAWHDSTLTKGPSQGSPRELISRLATQRSVTVGEDWSTFEHKTASSNMRYSYRVTCDSNYYGTGCSELCRPREDQFGHYTCSKNGTKLCREGWGGPYCDKANCLPGCHGQHGYCEEPNECRCRLGWQGVLCDKCIPYPGCQHGSCSVPWECKCEEGWGGLFCNQDLNYCTHHKPCKNAATCTNTGEGSYTCQCMSGYSGTNCEIEIDDCKHQPCLNGGTCVDRGTDYKCKCPKGFQGRHCGYSATSCQDSPCQNSGTCSQLFDTYQCNCRQGFTGVNCEVEINECSSDPCMNGGLCTDEYNGYRCVCPTGYSGPRCNENPNDCSVNPCLNGGTCLDGINNFQCRCIPGYVGPLCETNVDDCIMHPCANGGTCHDLVNDFTCSCAVGFAGKDCRNNIDECARNNCQNGGTCTDLVNDYKCTCATGFWGKDCQWKEGDIPVFTKQVDRNTITSTVIPVTVSSVQTTKIGGDPSLNQLQGSLIQEEPVTLTLQQLLLIVCLGAGIPIVIIIIIIVFLLCTRKRRENTDSIKKDNEQNEITNMNNKNKCVDTNIINSIPHSSVVLKITNEEQDSNNTLKSKQLSINNKTIHKQLMKDLNTNELIENSKDNIKPNKKVDTDEESSVHSDFIEGVPNIHIVSHGNSEVKSTWLPSLENHSSHAHAHELYQDGMLATEV